MDASLLNWAGVMYPKAPSEQSTSLLHPSGGSVTSSFPASPLPRQRLSRWLMGWSFIESSDSLPSRTMSSTGEWSLVLHTESPHTA